MTALPKPSAHLPQSPAADARTDSQPPVTPEQSSRLLPLGDRRGLSARARRLLWLDAMAAAAAGGLVLTYRDWFAGAFGFPKELVTFNAVANLAYGSFSVTLATLTALGLAPSRRWFRTLVVANAAWVPVCLLIVIRVWPHATPFGLAYVMLEASFVGVLALLEHRAFFGSSQHAQ